MSLRGIPVYIRVENVGPLPMIPLLPFTLLTVIGKMYGSQDTSCSSSAVVIIYIAYELIA